MKKRAIYLGLAILAFFAIAISVFGSQKAISVSELEEKVRLKQSFILQIELEGCPACEQLKKKEALLPFALRDVVVVHVDAEKKEVDRAKLKSLFPSFEFYPTLFYIRKGKVVSEFDLTTLDQFEKRFIGWRDMNLES